MMSGGREERKGENGESSPSDDPRRERVSREMAQDDFERGREKRLKEREAYNAH